MDLSELSGVDFYRSAEDDSPVAKHGSRGSSTLGYVIVLIGVAAFVLSCFLPYTQLLEQLSISYYRLATMSRGGTLQYVGGLLFLFGGTATVAWVALAGLRHGQHERRRTPSILLAVTVAWSLSWIGILVSVSGGFGYEVGYWSMLVSVAVVIVGTVVVWHSGRHTAHDPTQPLAPNRRGVFRSARPPGSPCGAGTAHNGERE
jgi:hypothetical protein